MKSQTEEEVIHYGEINFFRGKPEASSDSAEGSRQQQDTLYASIKVPARSLTQTTDAQVKKKWFVSYNMDYISFEFILNVPLIFTLTHQIKARREDLFFYCLQFRWSCYVCVTSVAFLTVQYWGFKILNVFPFWHGIVQNCWSQFLTYCTFHYFLKSWRHCTEYKRYSLDCNKDMFNHLIKVSTITFQHEQCWIHVSQYIPLKGISGDQWKSGEFIGMLV